MSARETPAIILATEATVNTRLALLFHRSTKVNINVSFAGKMSQMQNESPAQKHLIAKESSSPL